MRRLLMDAAWMLGSRPSMTEGRVGQETPFTQTRFSRHGQRNSTANYSLN
ncbi:UNVERIFIED_ORG: hypothetical protein GGE63_004811 [Rhizobium esperanzae]